MQIVGKLVPCARRVKAHIGKFGLFCLALGERYPYGANLGSKQNGDSIMDLRATITAAMKQAMRDKASDRLSTIRLINAAIKDSDIEARSDGNDDGVSDSDILAILAKMSRQRAESAKTYEEAGRLDLAERELVEIKVIEEFLPRQLNDEEVSAAIDAAIQEVGAESIRDMGRIMGVLKSKYTGQMDFGSVGPRVKNRLSS